MEPASGNDTSIPREDRVSLPATLIIAAGLAAAWIAAGSSGLLAHSLRQVLTCLVLGVGVVAGWPMQVKEWRSWAIFACGIAAALLLAILPMEVVNVLAVVIILATLAHLRGGLDGRAIFLTALAVLCFAVCRFLYGVCPRFWFMGEHVGQALGWLTSKITGQRLSVGATFGGVDFLLLMIFLYGFWLYNTASPRVNRALYGGLAIVAAQFAYLFVLAYAEKLVAVLIPIYPVEDDYMRMGAWIWQNSLRTMIPWNLPLIAVLSQTLVAAMMFRLASWRIDPSVMPQKSQVASAKSKTKKVVDRESAELSVLSGFGPAVAAMLLAALTALWTFEPVLNGKIIVAYQSAEVHWTTLKQGEPDENGYGLLPDFVQSLGGKFVFSGQLSAEELAKADVVLLLEPDAKFTKEQQSRLDEFVARGGSLLIASDRNATEDSRKKLGALLESAGIRIDSNFAASRIESWEQSSRAMNHPVSLGINDFRNGFGLDSSSTLSLQGTAYPLLLGRWGWGDSGGDLHDGVKSTYQAGDRLGDLVLIAESDRSNQGKIVVLGDMTCLSNDLLPVSYEFLGRLLGYLAQKTPAMSLWRTAGAGIFAALLLFFIVAMRKALQPAATALMFAVALVFCHVCTLEYQRIMPGESEKSPRRLAFIDASHLEAYSDKLWHPRPTVKEFTRGDWPDQGIGDFTRTLERNGYLPLRLREVSPEQLACGSLFISMAPGRSYSAMESEALRKFAADGGTLLCIAGAEESRAINPLLEKFNLQVPHSPVLPHETVREPEPNGSLSISYTKPEDNKQDTVFFFAAWDINSLARGSEGEEVNPQIFRSENNREKWMIVSRNVGNPGGCIAVIADTFFAANENPDPAYNTPAYNAKEAHERFWQWFLPRITSPIGTRTHNSPVDRPTNTPHEDEPMQESGPDEG